MTCQQFIEALAAYVEGELPSGKAAEADLHLEVCPDCVKYLESYEITIRLGKSALTEEREAAVPEELVQVILSARPRRT